MSVRIATAEWADPVLVEDKYRYRDGDVWLGRSAGDRQLPIGYRDDRHVCLVSGSRAGKGTSAIINNLCLWPGSAVVLDPKGENATVTVPRRGKGSARCDGMGQAVHVLDPFKAAQVDDGYRSRFNPLDALDPENEETIDEAGRIADAIVVIHEDSKDPFWDESARALVKGLLLHILTAEEYEGRRNLITLRKLITRGDWEAVEALRQAGESQIPPAQALLWTRVSGNPAFEGTVAGIGDTFANMLLSSPKQFESVLQVANRNTEFIDSPAMQRCLEASDFELAGLKTRKEGMSLYLCLPQRYMNTHYRWLRMMIALVVTEMEIVRGRPAAGFPILMLLDEFAGLKRMEVIENAVAQMAGYGVKLFFVLQSLEQLKAAYKDNWETFLANSGLKVFFGLDDHFSREYVSKLVGETEVIREVRSLSDGESESEGVSHGTSRSRSVSEGESFSRGKSISRGKSRSHSRSVSEGESESYSEGSSVSSGKSWTPGTGPYGGPSESYSASESVSSSVTRGTSRSRSESDTEGESVGWSESETEGRSRTEGWSEGESEGRTEGRSRSRTRGASETIHKRLLVSPDEIGHLFARVDDRNEPRFPGLALVVISGERTVALRRVNYYEDFHFVGRFEPHPDFPYDLRAKELCVNGEALSPLVDCLTFDGKPRVAISEWLVEVGQMVVAGKAVASVTAMGHPAGTILAPRTGMITAVPGRDAAGGIPHGALLWLMFEDNGEKIFDPFANVSEFFTRFVRTATEEMEKKTGSAVGWGAWAAVLAFIGILFKAYLIMLVPALACAGMMLKRIGERKRAALLLARAPKKFVTEGSVGVYQIDLERVKGRRTEKAAPRERQG